MGSGRAYSTPSPIADSFDRFAVFLGCIKLFDLYLYTTLVSINMMFKNNQGLTKEIDTRLLQWENRP